MGVQIPDKARGLLEGSNFCHLATLMPDGTPQLTPVWVDVDGDYVLINTAEGRLKVRNMRRDPRVAVEVSNAENPYEYVSIQGKVVEEDHDGADQHINKQSKKYLGQDEYPFRQPGEVRVIFKIEAEKVSTYGS